MIHRQTEGHPGERAGPRGITLTVIAQSKLVDPPREDSPRIAALREANLPAETWRALFLALATHVEKLPKPAPQRVELLIDYAETIASRSTNMLPRSAARREEERLLEEVQQLDLGRGVIKRARPRQRWLSAALV